MFNVQQKSGQDSPDVQFPAKVLSSEMANPTMASWRRLKKVVRFLVGRKRVVWRFPWQSVEEAAQLKVITDADWGGDKKVTEIDVWRCGDERQALFEDVINHTRNHRTVNSGGGIVRVGISGVPYGVLCVSQLPCLGSLPCLR